MKAMLELAEAAERQAHALMAEARDWYRRGAGTGSLDAALALVRLAVRDGDYEEGQWQLQDVARRHPDVPSARLVTVAPDVLGPRLSLEGDGVDDFPGAGTFTVISPDPQRAAAAVARVAGRLLYVDEHGAEHAEYEEPEDEAYTPNYLDDVKWCRFGALVSLDTKGGMWAAMGRTMVGILVEALVADGVPAHVTGYCRDLDTEWREWKDPG